jgi:hypothetical protein
MVNRTPNPCAGKGDVRCPMTVLYSTCFHHFSLLQFTSTYFLSVLLDLSLIFTPKLRFFQGGIMLRCRSVDRTSPSDFLAVSRHFAHFYHLHPLSSKFHPFSEEPWRSLLGASALSYCSHHVIRATRLPHALTICYPWMTITHSVHQL